MTNLEHINNFLDNLLYLKNYSQETINNYQRDLLQLNQALSDKNIISLTHSDILIWIKSYMLKAILLRHSSVNLVQLEAF